MYKKVALPSLFAALLAFSLNCQSSEECGFDPDQRPPNTFEKAFAQLGPQVAPGPILDFLDNFVLAIQYRRLPSTQERIHPGYTFIFWKSVLLKFAIDTVPGTKNLYGLSRSLSPREQIEFLRLFIHSREFRGIQDYFEQPMNTYKGKGSLVHLAEVALRKGSAP